ncbi:MAG: DMT family transporter [Spirulinaceae cyanobacterium RM2_2_10]|nr:DMT family transporter [Spirulinaceae cyanobacterium SM2_1_0]NJO19464.1 DMT family transporter [Spirulinaceae cyanobacterium RM2_2_10]
MATSSQTFQLSGRAYLMIAIAIFGAANAITRRLTDVGAENLIEGRNPISFCNVLFVGNLCALILLSIIYYRQWRPSVLRQISWQSWLTMTLVAILGAAVVPTLIFTALSLTAVNNVILLGQVDTPLILVLSVWLLGDRVNAWVVAGAVVAFIGVSLTVLLQSPDSEMMTTGVGFAIGRGELYTLIAAVGKAIGNLISRINLQQIPLGIFSTYRMLIGTIAFFIATVVLYGPEHFMDVASPFLWQWMLLYSAVIVVGGQLSWFSGLKQSSASEVSLATAFTPLAGVLAAYLILGEAPTFAQYIGGGVIVGGIALNQIGVQRLNVTAPEQQPTKQAMTEAIGYKGV